PYAGHAFRFILVRQQSHYKIEISTPMRMVSYAITSLRGEVSRTKKMAQRLSRLRHFFVRSGYQTARRTINSLILPIALVGLSPLGHTSTQFMIVWQRNRRYGSSRLSRRSPVASSRLSAMKRYACSSPAGPTNLSGFHQKLGQLVEQLAHRMHSYRPSSSSRSVGDCRRSLSGGWLSLIRYGLIEWYWVKNCVKSQIRSRTAGRARRGP